VGSRAEDLGIELDESWAAAAGPMALSGPSALSSTPKVIDYRPGEPGKPLIVNIGKFVPALDYVKDIPLDFNLNLGPVGTLKSDAKVTVTAHVGLDPEFGLGIYLGSFVPGADTLERDTLLEDLNNGDGVRIKTAPALTAENSVPTDVVKAPSADVTFTITINGTQHTISVPAANDSGDINVTKAFGDQREVTIAVNPHDPKNIVVAPNNSPGIFGNTENTTNGTDDDGDGLTDEPALSRDSLWVTMDGGINWTEKVIQNPVGAVGGHGDPTIKFGRDGRIVYVHQVDKTGPHGDHVMA